MRQDVRAWINAWDLRRLDPSYVPHITASAVSLEYGEDADLEGSGHTPGDDAADG